MRRRLSMTPDETAETILVAHQRLDITGCVCGWSELGKSHPKHQVAMLHEAGLRLAHEDPVAAGQRLPAV